MENYLLTLFSVLISVFLFYLTYRQTIGAKKERISSANDEVEKILIRRIALEDFTPKIDEISRLLEGKARDHKVDVNDLLSESQIMNTIYTRILETDFITQEQREKILMRINGSILQLAETPIEESEIELLPSSRRNILAKTILPIVFSLATSIIGTFISLFPDFKMIEANKSTTEFISLILAMVGVTFSVTIIFYFFRKFKDSSDGNSKNAALQKYVEIEKTVEDIIVKYGYRIIKSRDVYYDFLIEKYDKRYIIEVKNWANTLPISFIQDRAFKMNEYAKYEKAEKAFIVTPSKIKYSEEMNKYEFVTVISIKELRNYLAHN